MDWNRSSIRGNSHGAARYHAGALCLFLISFFKAWEEDLRPYFHPMNNNFTQILQPLYSCNIKFWQSSCWWNLIQACDWQEQCILTEFWITGMVLFNLIVAPDTTERILRFCQRKNAQKGNTVFFLGHRKHGRWENFEVFCHGPIAQWYLSGFHWQVLKVWAVQLLAKGTSVRMRLMVNDGKWHGVTYTTTL